MANFKATQFNFTANASNLFKELTKMNSKFDKTSKGIKNTVGNISGALAGIGAGVIGVDLIKNVADFEQKLNAVAAVSGATGQQLEQLENIARQMGETTRFSATQAAEGLQNLAMAGLTVDESISALPNVLQLATVGLLDLGTAADIATNVMSGFGLEVEELSRVNDVLAKTVTSSNTNIEQLGGSLKFVAPTAAGLGIALEEVNAILGTFANRGIRGFLAGTNLRSILQKLIKPSAEAQKELDKLGITIDENALRTKGLTGVFAELNEKQLTGRQISTLFGTEIASTARIMLDSTEEIEAFTEALENSEGAAAAMQEIMDGGLPGALKRMESAFGELKIAMLKGGIMDAIIDVIDGVRKLVLGFSKMPDVLKNATVAFVALAAVLGPVVAVGAILGPMLGTIGAAAGAAAVAITALGIGFATANDEMEESSKAARKALGATELQMLKYETRIPNLIKKLKKLDGAEKLTSDQQALRRDIVEELIGLDSSFAAALTGEKANIDDLTTAYEELMKAQMDVFKLQNVDLATSLIKQLGEVEKKQKELSVATGTNVNVIPKGTVIGQDEYGQDVYSTIATFREKSIEQINDEEVALIKTNNIATVLKNNLALLGIEGYNLGDALAAAAESGEDFTALSFINLDRLEPKATKKKKKKAETNTFKPIPVGAIGQAAIDDANKMFEQSVEDARKAGEKINSIFDDTMQGIEESGKLADTLDFGSIFKISEADAANDKMQETLSIYQSIGSAITELEGMDPLTDMNADEQQAKIAALREELELYRQKLIDLGIVIDANNEKTARQQAVGENLAAGMGIFTNALGAYESALMQLNQVRSDSEASAEDLVKAEEKAAQARKNIIRNTIKAFIAEAVAAMVAKAIIETSAISPWLAPAAGALAAGLATVAFEAAIPSFAEGGVVSGPTLAMVGDAPGVNNPEFISPRKDMMADIKSAVQNGGGAGGQMQFVVRGQDLVTVLDREADFTSTI